MLTIGVFTFGDALLTVLELALLFMWIWVAVGVILDLFRSHDLSGLAKAAWALLIVVFPLIGVLLYLFVRGQDMHDRQFRAAAAQQDALRHYMRTAARTPAEDLAILDDLRNRGVLTDEEFDRAKAKVLA